MICSAFSWPTGLRALCADSSHACECYPHTPRSFVTSRDLEIKKSALGRSHAPTALKSQRHDSNYCIQRCKIHEESLQSDITWASQTYSRASIFGTGQFPKAPVAAVLAVAVQAHAASAIAAGSMADAGASASDLLYLLATKMDFLVQQQLQGVSVVTFLVTFAAGLLTSLSPCTLSVLPLTLGYIGGYSSSEGRDSGTLSRAAAFSFGLATTLAVLGIGSSLLGRTYGQFGDGLPIAVGLVAILMGLNLLELLPLALPSLDVDVRKIGAPPLAQAYLAGLTFALAASPCSTPVLATLLAYVATSQEPLLGGGLLLAYTSGYVIPLMVAATFAGTLKQVLAMRQWSAWITPASGVLLLSGGTYTLLSRLLY